MDAESRFALLRSVGQEIVTEEELKHILETHGTGSDAPIAYDGFEPSGFAHLPVGVYRPLLLKQLLSAGIRFKLLVADSFAWINDKAGGDLERVRMVGKYFVEVWKASGIPFGTGAGKVEIVYHKDAHFSDPDYWRKVLAVAKEHSEARTKRCLTIAGRTEDDIKQTAQLFYPSMQVADVFQLDCDIVQLGMDQRKANMLAREVADKLSWKKPVAVHHRMLLGLDGVQSASAADEGSREVEFPHEPAGPGIDSQIASKMSKSKPETSIFVHDSTAEIAAKIGKAYCPAKVVTGNPVLEYAQELVFRAHPTLTIMRPEKFGGDVTFSSYHELEKAFAAGSIHPQDLKAGVAMEIDSLIAPIRTHFQTNGEAKALYAQLADLKVTR